MAPLAPLVVHCLQREEHKLFGALELAIIIPENKLGNEAQPAGP